MVYLLKLIFNYLQKEPAVLYPSIIISFGLLWLTYFFKINFNNIEISTPIIEYFLLSWLLNIFIYLLTAGLCKNVLAGEEPSLTANLKLSLLKLIPALAGSAFLILLMASLVLAAKYHLLLNLLSIPLLLICSVFYFIFPVIYIFCRQNIFKTFLLLIIFFKEKFRVFFNILVFVIFILTLKYLLSLLIFNAPGNIKSILLPVSEGVFNVINIYAVLIFWQVNQSKISVKI